jgi:phosphoribosylformimino-5-aminoimidazole carboxamide ribotide isomerase
MELYPAIDLRGGEVVRLAQGESDRQTSYGTDPAAQARAFAEAGARWLHVVDLDRAFGTGDNDAAIAAIVAAVGSALAVQVGGGVRSVERARSLAELGVTRVILGTAAVERPALVDEVVAALGPDAVAVGIDARDGAVALRGWTETSAVRATDLAARVAGQGVRTVIYTDIARDGMLGGPDLAGSVALQAAAGVSVIASGGIATLEDLRAVADAGLGGAITGRALYEGRFALADALAVARG